MCFYEDLLSIPAAREDMPRWFTPADIVGLNSVFVYAYGTDGYDALLAHVVPNRHRYMPRVR